MTRHDETPRPPDDSASPAGGATSPRPRTWRIEFPARQELLNSNHRRNRYAHNRVVQQLRADAHWLARHHNIPRLERARIDATYQPSRRGRRDAGNWYPTYKAQIDGLVDAGVLPDDDDTRLDGPHMRIGDPHPGGRVVLVITELPPKETTP